MYFMNYSQAVPVRTQRLLAFLLSAVGYASGKSAPGQLPPGTVVLRDAGLILATTRCPAPMFRQELSVAAQHEGHDAILMRYTSTGDCLQPTTFDVFTMLNHQSFVLPNLELHRGARGYCLLSRWGGYHVELAPGGILLRSGVPFASEAERSAGVAAAGWDLERAVRPGAF